MSSRCSIRGCGKRPTREPWNSRLASRRRNSWRGAESATARRRRGSAHLLGKGHKALRPARSPSSAGGSATGVGRSRRPPRGGGPQSCFVSRRKQQSRRGSPAPNDLTKKLDKLAAQAGWYTFVSAQAHAIATGKAPARRNAEIMVVQEITRWRREVERFATERLDEFDAGIRHALEHPAALPRPEAG